MAVVAFFALRPRKGWLRRKGNPGLDTDLPPTAPGEPYEVDTFMHGSRATLSASKGAAIGSRHLPYVPSTGDHSRLGSAAEVPTPGRSGSRPLRCGVEAQSALQPCYATTNLAGLEDRRRPAPA